MPQETQQPRRRRQCNIIWFNPPFNKNVETNIARSFLNLVNTFFPVDNKLRKVINRDTVFKGNYTCMSNVRSIITSHNARITRKANHKTLVHTTVTAWKWRKQLLPEIPRSLAVSFSYLRCCSKIYNRSRETKPIKKTSWDLGSSPGYLGSSPGSPG